MSNLFQTLSIDEIRDESPDAYSLIFRDYDPEFYRYTPGQYLTVRLQIEGKEYRRAYSLSSSPQTDDYMSVTIKREPGGIVSNFIRDYLAEGDMLDLMRPMGHFTLSPHPEQKRHYIMIGGGSGITPLMSMLKSLLAVEIKSKVSLWYGSRNEDSIFFYSELEQLGKQYPERLHVYHSLSQPSGNWKGVKGRLDKDHIYQLLLELFMEDEFRKQYYLCGPQGLMDAAEAAFDKHAVNPSDVHREFFSAPVPTEEQVEKVWSEGEEEDEEEELIIYPQTVQIRLNGETHLLDVRPEQSILDAAVEKGLDPPYSCLAGTCSSCMARLEQGEVAMDQFLGLTDEEMEAGYVLSCQSHPMSDDVELVFEDS